MSKKRRKGAKGPSSTRNWGTTDSAVFNSNVGSVLFTSNRVVLDKNRIKPALGSPLVNGWRYPTAFRCYVCSMIPQGAFRYTTASIYPQYHEGGMSYSINGAYNIYLGTSGAGVFPRTSQNMINRATTECLLKLNEGTINLAESIATANLSLRLIYESLTNMRLLWDTLTMRSLKNIKRWDDVSKAYTKRSSYPSASYIPWSKFATSRSVPLRRPSHSWFKDQGSLWLQLQYGWKPLVSDIYGALSLLKDQPPPRLNAVRHLEDTEVPVILPGYGIQTLTGSIRNGVHVRMDAELSSPGLALLNSFNLLNPFSLAWELLPYSFVLDWLLPIGSLLEGLTAGVGLTAKGISTTTFSVADVSITWTDFAGTVIDGTPISYRVKSMASYRVVGTTFPLPRPYIKSPFTATRTVTALALLLSRR